MEVKRVLIASAELCAKLKIRALKAGDSSKAEIFAEIERQFRRVAAENSATDRYGLHRASLMSCRIRGLHMQGLNR
jgi:hypothetical protein